MRAAPSFVRTLSTNLQPDDVFANVCDAHEAAEPNWSTMRAGVIEPASDHIVGIGEANACNAETFHTVTCIRHWNELFDRPFDDRRPPVLKCTTQRTVLEVRCTNHCASPTNANPKKTNGNAERNQLGPRTGNHRLFLMSQAPMAVNPMPNATADQDL
jgi:hypothetical protein